MDRIKSTPETPDVTAACFIGNGRFQRRPVRASRRFYYALQPRLFGIRRWVALNWQCTQFDAISSHFLIRDPTELDRTACCIEFFARFHILQFPILLTRSFSFHEPFIDFPPIGRAVSNHVLGFIDFSNKQCHKKEQQIDSIQSKVNSQFPLDRLGIRLKPLTS